MKELIFYFKRPWAYCDYLNLFKFFIGIALIISGLLYKNWLGLIGLYPILVFYQYLSSPECKINPKEEKGL